MSSAASDPGPRDAADRPADREFARRAWIVAGVTLVALVAAAAFRSCILLRIA